MILQELDWVHVFFFAFKFSGPDNNNPQEKKKVRS
jgi:hypothetical protein